ncbi:MAG: hypothetical protein K6E49_05595 [Lachnospiraceae bacterium]|nr:hypothetical protein [Lachnospiraceae bacterium]
MKLGRGLLEEIVTYKLLQDGATNIEFTVKDYDPNSTTNAAKGVINPKNPQKVDVGKEHTLEWGKVSGDNGRNNHLTVTYTDAEGNKQTQYFNYIYKDKKYNDGDGETSNIYANQEDFINDLKKGIIYVSEVKQVPVLDANGHVKKDKNGNDVLEWKYQDKYETAESHKAFGFLDNYQTLSDLAAKQAEAEKAVKAATTEVENLKKQITELCGDITGEENPDLDKLEADLEEKETILAENRAELKVLNDLISKYNKNTPAPAPAPVPGNEDPVNPNPGNVDPFNPNPGTADEDDGDDGEVIYDDGDITVTIPGGFVPTPVAAPEPIVLPDFLGFTDGGTAPATGVLGVRVDAPETATGNGAYEDGGQEEDGEGGEIKAADNTALQNRNNAVNRNNKDAAKKIVRLEDGEVPLAEMPNTEDGVEMSWWWLLVIFLLGATGKKLYDKYQENKREKENEQI